MNNKIKLEKEMETLLIPLYGKAMASTKKKTKATIHWGIDQPLEITRWMPGITFLDERYFTSNQVVQKMSWGMRWMYKLAHLFPIARNAQRILIYKIGHA